MLLKTKSRSVTIKDSYFAKGGEGCVHDITRDKNSVAKIYHKKQRTKEREQKILAMLGSPPQGNLSKQVAWPTDILYSQSGEFMGFIMPKITGTIEISEIYSFDNRKKYPFTFYIQVAQNLCAAVNAVHSGGHVCGDLNHANVHVNPITSLVTLVDTDSYEIKGKRGRRFRCPVGLPEYVPAEVGKVLNMGENLRTTSLPTFTKYTDYFALGIHIFKLLMNGAHPYACSVTNPKYSGSEFTLDKNIVDGVFPYRYGETRVSPPKYAPNINSLPASLVKLITKTFDTKANSSPVTRATPQQWYDELGTLEKSLIQCPNSVNHQYYNKNSTCPLCETEKILSGILSKPNPVPIGKPIKVPSPVTAPPSGISNTPPSPFRPTGGGSTRRSIFSVVIEFILFILYYMWLPIKFVLTLPFKLLKKLNKYPVGVILGIVSFVCFELFIFWLLSLIPLSGWLWNIILFALMVLSVYGPFLICTIIVEIIKYTPPPKQGIMGGMYYTLEKSNYLAMVLFPTGIIIILATGGMPEVSFNIQMPSIEGISLSGPIAFWQSLPPLLAYGGIGIVALILVIILREVPITGFVLGFGVWVGFQFLGIWLMGVVNVNAWWFWFVRLAWFAIMPYIPLWIFALLDSIFVPFNTLWENMCIVMNASFFITIFCYGGFALYSTWGTGLLNMIIYPILICAPATFLFAKFPDITSDLI